LGRRELGQPVGEEEPQHGPTKDPEEEDQQQRSPLKLGGGGRESFDERGGDQNHGADQHAVGGHGHGGVKRERALGKYPVRHPAHGRHEQQPIPGERTGVVLPVNSAVGDRHRHRHTY